MNKRQFKKIIREEVKNVLNEFSSKRTSARASMNRMGHLKLEFMYNGHDVDAYIQNDRSIEEYIYDFMIPNEPGIGSSSELEEELQNGYEVDVKLDDQVAEMTYYQWLDNQ